ncbi:MAG: hypothetical protein AB7D43_11490 [Sulfurimonadaceae bacterium]|jgi:hypothetical protein
MKILKKLGLGLLGLAIIFTVKYFIARLDYTSSELYKTGDSQTFHFNSSNVIKELGFNYSSSDLNGSFGKFDGNFTIEYFHNNSIVETKNVTLESLSQSKYPVYIMHDSGGSGHIPLDVNDKEIDQVRITVNKPFSSFKNFNGPLYVYYKDYKDLWNSK